MWRRPLPSQIPDELLKSGSKLDRACKLSLPLLDAHAPDEAIVEAFESQGFSKSTAVWLLPHIRRFGTAGRLRDAIISPPWDDYDPRSAFHSLLWFCVKPWRARTWLVILMLLVAAAVGILFMLRLGPYPNDRPASPLIGLAALGVAGLALVVEGLLSHLIFWVANHRDRKPDNL